MNLEDIRNIIAQGDTASAIKALISRVQEGAGRSKRLRDDLFILSNRFEEFKRKETLGMLDQADTVREHAQVNDALLNLIEEIESDAAVKTTDVRQQPTSSVDETKRLRWILIAAGGLLMIGVLIYFMIKPSKPIISEGKKPIETVHNRFIKDTVFVEGGIYEMGSKDGEEDEYPHTVVVNSYYIDKHEITNEQYASFLNEKGKHDSLWIDLGKPYKQERCRIFLSSGQYQVEQGYQKHPVINVTYNGALEYAQYYGMRLPTEAEWEYAARGGSIGKSHNYLFSGNNAIDVVAWNPGNSNGIIHPVKIKAPNELGIYDMSGNLYEWCSDYYDPKFYFNGIRENPQCLVQSKFKVVRGGNIFLPPEFCRVANRGFLAPETASAGVGFRCVKDK